jgi:hypothetical protein
MAPSPASRLAAAWNKLTTRTRPVATVAASSVAEAPTATGAASAVVTAANAAATATARAGLSSGARRPTRSQAPMRPRSTTRM